MLQIKTNSLKNAVLVNALGKYLNIIINLFFTAILARLLTPEDYGIVAVVTVFTTFFSLFSDMGFGTAVIQNKELTKDDIRNIYSFTVYVGFVLSVLFVLFSYPLSYFYDNEVYFSLGALLAISLFFRTLNMIPNALLMREKKFVILSIRTIVEVTVGGIITVVLAVAGFKYYALVISSIFQAILAYVWNLNISGLRFVANIQFNSIKKVLSFSLFQFAFNFINYFSRNLDNLLTGKFMGSVMLGYYDKAYKLTQYPISNLTHVITPVLHPILSEYQDDKEYIYDKYMQILKLLAVVGVFVSAFCFLAAEELVDILYGDNWGQSVQCFMWLSISVWAQMLSSSTGSIFQSLNKTKEMFIIGSINTVLNIMAIIIGVSTGNIVNLSICVGCCYVLQFFTTFIALIKVAFSKSFFSFLFEFTKEWIIGFILIIGIVLYPFNLHQVIMSLCAKLLYIGVLYIISLGVTGDYKLFIKIL